MMTAARIKRDGHDRIYVNDGDARLGYVDIGTGERVMAFPERTKDFEETIAVWLAEHDILVGKAVTQKSPSIISASPGH